MKNVQVTEFNRHFYTACVCIYKEHTSVQNITYHTKKKIGCPAAFKCRPSGTFSGEQAVQERNEMVLLISIQFVLVFLSPFCTN